jgi:hypothetical protein
MLSNTAQEARFPGASSKLGVEAQAECLDLGRYVYAATGAQKLPSRFSKPKLGGRVVILGQKRNFAK